MKITKMQKEVALSILETVCDNLDAKMDYNTNLSYETVSERFTFALTETELCALFNFINTLKNEDI